MRKDKMGGAFDTNREVEGRVMGKPGRMR